MRSRNDTEAGARQIAITPGYLKHPEGSALIEVGDTRVVCAASVEYRVKDWLRGKGRGWVTAEYAMLPRANATRGLREGQFGRWPSSRSQEIQRLIGRCLRAAIRPKRLGEITITIDCDVLQADGGTRTASVTGGFVALALALDRLAREKRIKPRSLYCQVAATSVGIVGDEVLLDLDYGEDSTASVDLNIAADDRGGIVDVQGTAEQAPFDATRLARMVDVGLAGVAALCRAQREALATAGVDLDALIERREESR
jgi:ribonuclease PH